MPKKQGGYFQVDNNIFDNETIGLNWCAKLVYIFLSRCSNQGTTAFPSYKTIANRCGMSKRSAVKAVGILEERRFITVNRSKHSTIKNNANQYKVLPLPGLKKKNAAPERVDYRVLEPISF